MEESFDLDGSAVARVLGKGGGELERLRREFPGCRVEVKGERAHSHIRLAGPSGAVGACRAELDRMVRQFLESSSSDYTHFVSLPLNSPELIAALEGFRDRALALEPEERRGLDPTVFAKPQHFHLTVCMLKLYSEASRRRASEVLCGFDFAALRARPLCFSLGGLATFSKSLEKADVLFTQVAEDAGGRLQALVDALGRAFGEAGLLLPRDRKPVKLHATIVNTRFRRGPAGKGGGRRRTPCDCSRVVERLGGELSSGELRLEEVHLSQRGAYRDSDGYYLPLEVIKLL